MISDNHNAYNNYNNYIDEYELTNGYAVVDRNFSIVTANEPMYLFLGMSKHYSIMDAIHQVVALEQLHVEDRRTIVGRRNFVRAR